MVKTRTETHQILHWSEGWRFVQFMKNEAHHEAIAIQMTPYPAKFGLKTSLFPSDLHSEEDLVALNRVRHLALRYDSEMILIFKILTKDTDKDDEKEGNTNEGERSAKPQNCPY